MNHELNETLPEFVSNSMYEHQLIVFLCDTSGSMYGDRICNTNLLLNNLAEDVKTYLKDSVYVDASVIAFNDVPYVVQEFMPLTELHPVCLSASGCTNLSSALEFAMNMLNERRRYYYDHCITVEKTHIFLITDGYCDDVTQTAEIISRKTIAQKLRLWVIASDNCDERTIDALTRGKGMYRFTNIADDELVCLVDIALRMGFREAPDPDTMIHVVSPPPHPDHKVPDLDEWLNEYCD